MTTGQSLDTVNESLVKEQLDRIQQESDAKQKALSILQRKVDYALRPVVKKKKQAMTSSSEDESEQSEAPQQTHENNTIEELDSSSNSSSPKSISEESEGVTQVPDLQNNEPHSATQMIVMQEFDFSNQNSKDEE